MSDNTFEAITAALGALESTVLCPACRESEVDMRVTFSCMPEAELLCLECWAAIARPLWITAKAAEQTGAVMLHASCGAELHSVADLMEHITPDWLPGREPEGEEE